MGSASPCLEKHNKCIILPYQVTCSVVLKCKISIFLNREKEGGVSGEKWYLQVSQHNQVYLTLAWVFACYKHKMWNFRNVLQALLCNWARMKAVSPDLFAPHKYLDTYFQSKTALSNFFMKIFRFVPHRRVYNSFSSSFFKNNCIHVTERN